MRRIFFVAIIILLSVAIRGAESRSLEPVEWSREHMFNRMPFVAEIHDGNAILRFTTVHPAVSTVYYGGFPADQDLTLPLFRFRTKAKEMDPDGSYEAHLKIYRFAQDTYNMAKGSTLEGVVAYRVGTVDEEEGIVRYYESRFRFGKALQGDDENWTLRPCIIEGPFVDMITDRSAVISLDTDSLCYARIKLGDRLVASLDARGRPLKARHHEIRIGALNPTRRYTYHVEIAADADFQMNALVWPQQVFQTAPLPGSRTAFSFAFMSDSRQSPGGGELGFGGVNYKILQQFMVDLYRRRTDLVLFGGDLVNGYTSSEESYLRQLRTWKKAVEPVGSSVPIYEGMGNHEQVGDYLKITMPGEDPLTIYTNRAGAESEEALFASQFVNPGGSAYGFGPPVPENQWPGVGQGLPADAGEFGLPQMVGPPYDETVYSFQYDNLHFVSLNTNYWHTGVYYGSREQVNVAVQLVGGNREGYIMQKQLDWLKRDLDAAQSDENIDWIVLFAHEPAFPAGGHLRDAMFWGQKVDDRMVGLNDPRVPAGDVIDMRNRFWSLVSSYPKTLAVLFGDEHNYSRTYVDHSMNSSYRYPVWQIISGGAGAPFYGQDFSAPWTNQVKKFTSVPHYCLAKVKGKEVQLEVWTRSGQLVEQVLLSDLPR